MKNDLRTCSYTANWAGACLLITALCISPVGPSAKAQGLVQFLNTSTTLISDGLDLISGPPGTYYFGLLIAPPGTTDPFAFTFSGLYATNMTTPGSLLGGSLAGVPVPGWPAGAQVSFMVAGWRSAHWGHDWDPQMLWGDNVGVGFSMIATAALGSTNPFPMPLRIFGPNTISNGFNVMGCERFAGWLVQPTNQTVAVGAPTLLSAAVLACPSPSLTWYFNGSPIAQSFSSTTTSVALASAQLANAGDYYVVASVLELTALYFTSSVAHLTVAAPPLLTQQPQSQTAVAGSNVEFRVNATGTPALSYQWLLNGSNNIGGATKRSLQIPSVSAANAGDYRAVITNVYGAVTSVPAMLSVVPPVPQQPVPGLALTGAPGTMLTVQSSAGLGPADSWSALGSVVLAASPEWYFDATNPLTAPQTFYRAIQTNGVAQRPLLDLHLLPAIVISGSIGSSVRMDYIDQFGPTDAWVTLATIGLTNSSQLYFDTSSIGQPPRIYRLVTVPSGIRRAAARPQAAAARRAERLPDLAAP